MGDHEWKVGDRFTIREGLPEDAYLWGVANPNKCIALSPEFVGVVFQVQRDWIRFQHPDAVLCQDHCLTIPINNILHAPDEPRASRCNCPIDTLMSAGCRCGGL